MAETEDVQAKECDGCKLRDERILVLERLVTLHQMEPKRRATVEVESDALIARANELQEKINGDSAERNGPPSEG